MKETLMDKLIRKAREELKNGASLEALQQDLRQNLSVLTASLKLDKKQLNNYNYMIDNLDKEMNARITFINKKAIARIAIASAAVLLVGCGVKEHMDSKAASAISADASDDQKEDETNNQKVEEISTQQAEQAPEQTTEEQNVEYVLPDYLTFNANDASVAITNVSEFLNDGLAKGLTTVKDENGKLVSSLTEKNLSKKIEAYLSMYIMANINNIDYKLLASLNQEGNLTADGIFEKAINAMGETYYDSLTETKDNVLKTDMIFADKNDVEYINKFDELIVKFNEGNDSERKDVIKEATSLKEDLLTYIAGKKTEINPFAIDYAFTKLEVLDTLANGMIITDNEDDIKLYNAIIAECITDEQKEGYGIEDALTKFNDTKSLTSLKSIVRNMAYSIIVEKMEAAINYTTQVELNNETSFNYLVSEIASKINLDNFKANPYDFSDWVLMVIGHDKDIVNDIVKGSAPTAKTVTKNNIDPKDVPDSEKVKPEKTSTVKEDGKTQESNETYIEAKADAIEDASRDVADLYEELGSSLKISKISVPAQPSPYIDDYDNVYDYWYAVTYNSTLKSFQNAEKDAKVGNQTTKPTYEEAENEKVVDKSNNYYKPRPSNEYYYVPEQNFVVVDEGIIEEKVEIPTNNNQVIQYSEQQNNVVYEPTVEVQEDIIEEPTTEVNEGLLLNNYQSQIDELEALKSMVLSTTSSLDNYTNKGGKTL